jgi:hypothetical protein
MMPGTCQTPPLARPSPVHDDTVDVFRHGHRNARTMTTRPFLLWPHHDARRAHRDTRDTPRPSPAPSMPWNGDATINLPAPPRPSLAPINADAPWTISAHPLSSLTSQLLLEQRRPSI